MTPTCVGAPVRYGARLWLAVEDVMHRLLAASNAADAAGDGRMIARMDGRIQREEVVVGQSLRVGDTLLVLKAMKMEFALADDLDDMVEALHCGPG